MGWVLPGCVFVVCLCLAVLSNTHSEEMTVFSFFVVLRSMLFLTTLNCLDLIRCEDDGI